VPVDVFQTDAFRERAPDLAARLEASPAAVWRVSDALMSSLAATESPQGIVATIRMPSRMSTLEVGASLLAVALDDVSDPGNVGTIIRAAHATGADGVILGAGCCNPFNPKAVRASAGGVFAVPLLTPDDLCGCLRSLRSEGASVFAAAASRGLPYWERDLTGPAVLLAGNEAHGLSADVLACADGVIAIPMPGGAESLNAGTATTVLLCEAVRQRMCAAADGRTP
jgi:TrmH family RNA methyltransferase